MLGVVQAILLCCPVLALAGQERASTCRSQGLPISLGADDAAPGEHQLRLVYTSWDSGLVSHAGGAAVEFKPRKGAAPGAGVAQLGPVPVPGVEAGWRSYQVERISVHSPSVHAVRGRRSDLEVQIEHAPWGEYEVRPGASSETDVVLAQQRVISMREPSLELKLLRTNMEGVVPNAAQGDVKEYKGVLKSLDSVGVRVGDAMARLRSRAATAADTEWSGTAGNSSKERWPTRLVVSLLFDATVEEPEGKEGRSNETIVTDEKPADEDALLPFLVAVLKKQKHAPAAHSPVHLPNAATQGFSYWSSDDWAQNESLCKDSAWVVLKDAHRVSPKHVSALLKVLPALKAASHEPDLGTNLDHRHVRLITVSGEGFTVGSSGFTSAQLTARRMSFATFWGLQVMLALVVVFVSAVFCGGKLKEWLDYPSYYLLMTTQPIQWLFIIIIGVLGLWRCTCADGMPWEYHEKFMIYVLYYKYSEALICLGAQGGANVPKPLKFAVKQVLSVLSLADYYTDLVGILVMHACGSWLWIPALTVYVVGIVFIQHLLLYYLYEGTAAKRVLTAREGLEGFDGYWAQTRGELDDLVEDPRLDFAVALLRLLSEDLPASAIQFYFIYTVRRDPMLYVSVSVAAASSLGGTMAAYISMASSKSPLE